MWNTLAWEQVASHEKYSPCGSAEWFGRFALRLEIFRLRLSCGNLNLLQIKLGTHEDCYPKEKQQQLKTPNHPQTRVLVSWSNVSTNSTGSFLVFKRWEKKSANSDEPFFFPKLRVCHMNKHGLMFDLALSFVRSTSGARLMLMRGSDTFTRCYSCNKWRKQSVKS